MDFPFINPAATFTSGIEDALVQQQARQRQALLDELNRRNQESIISDRDTASKIAQQNANSLEQQRIRGTADDEAKAALLKAQQAQEAKDAQIEVNFGDYLDQNPNASTSDMRKYLVKNGYSMSKIAPFVKQIDDAAIARERMKNDQNKSDQVEQLKRDLADQTDQRMRDIAMMVNGTRQSAQAEKAQRDQEKKDQQAKQDRLTAQGVIDAADEIDKTLGDLLTQDKSGKPMLTPGLNSITGGLGHGAIPGVVSKLFGNLPGMKNMDAQAALDQLISQKMIGLMTEMKSASKTGATGFGQLSEKEGEILRNASARLQQSQSPEAMVAALQDVADSVKRIRRHANMIMGGSNELPSGKIDIPSLMNKYGVGNKGTLSVDDLLNKYGGSK